MPRQWHGIERGPVRFLCRQTDWPGRSPVILQPSLSTPVPRSKWHTGYRCFRSVRVFVQVSPCLWGADSDPLPSARKCSEMVGEMGTETGETRAAGYSTARNSASTELNRPQQTATNRTRESGPESVRNRWGNGGAGTVPHPGRVVSTTRPGGQRSEEHTSEL